MWLLLTGVAGREYFGLRTRPIAPYIRAFSEWRVTHPESCNETPFLENFAVDDHGMLLGVATRKQ